MQAVCVCLSSASIVGLCFSTRANKLRVAELVHAWLAPTVVKLSRGLARVARERQELRESAETTRRHALRAPASYSNVAKKIIFSWWRPRGRVSTSDASLSLVRTYETVCTRRSYVRTYAACRSWLRTEGLAGSLLEQIPRDALARATAYLSASELLGASQRCKILRLLFESRV